VPNPFRQFRWNPVAARYIGPTGTFVSRRELRQALDQAITAERRLMRAALGELRSGRISLDSWVLGMRQSVKLTHLWSAALAKGGWAQLTFSDYGAVGQTLRFHYSRLDRLAEQIAAGLPLDGRVTVRVEMYAESARKTYHDIEFRTIVASNAYTEERNIIDPIAEHCAGCDDASARGWVPLGSLPLPGQRTCLTNCKCRMEYR
jgi:hypothetical protein